MLKNKTCDVIGLVTNTAFNTKVGEVEKNPDYTKYITDNEFNKFSGEIFDVKLKKTKLVANADLVNVEQRVIENKKQKNKKHCLIFFIGKNCVGNHGSQNYLIVQLLYDFLNKLTGTKRIMGWKS